MIDKFLLDFKGYVMKKQLAANTQVVLANAGELTKAIVFQVMGNDVSNSINGTQLGAKMLNSIVQARIQKTLNA
jgi:hypothetical protein